MAHASKSFVVFTGGEWSEQLHGRTDLAKADAAGRKVRNFVPAQTGRLSRRKGLEFVGAALGECLAGDPRFMVPEWGSLDDEATIDPTIDVYGSLGPEELRTSENVGPIWQVCANIQYCYGPTEEGATMQNIGDRYRTRWVAKLEDGRMYYRRVGTGEDWTPVPNELVPQPNDTFNGIGFCFDANARPCFASAIGDDIHIWRWVADVPTTYSFPGQGPRLFFNGVLQFDNSFWDVMCYFCWNGDLVASFQRENFETNYTLFTSEDHYLTRVRYLDRGIGANDSERLYIAATGNSGLYGMFRTPDFPLWPVLVESYASSFISIASDGDCYPVILATGPYADTSSASIGLATDGDCAAIILVSGPYSSAASSALSLATDGDCAQIIVSAGNYADYAATTISLAVDGECEEVVMSGGSYTSSTSSSILLATDGECVLA